MYSWFALPLAYNQLSKAPIRSKIGSVETSRDGQEPIPLARINVLNKEDKSAIRILKSAAKKQNAQPNIKCRYAKNDSKLLDVILRLRTVLVH